jgi:hypothetical protein
VSSLGGALTLRNTVRDMRIAGALASYGAARTRTLGYEVAAQDYLFRASYPLVIYPSDTLRSRNTTVGVFLDDQWRPAPKWIVQSGLRLDAVRPTGRIYVQPRLGVKYFVDPDLALTAAYGEFAQSAHTLAREDVPIRALDFWVGSDARAPVSRSRHFIAGVERWLPGNRAARLELYLKQYPSLIEQNPHSDPALEGDEFLRLRGYSYGADVMLRQFDRGGVTGWLSYSFVFNRRVDETGRAYFPGQDRRHEASLIVSRSAGRYTMSGRFNVATGTPYTLITGNYTAQQYNPGTQTIDTDGIPRFLSGPRNAERLPLASRLDFSITRNGRGGVAVSPFLSIMNVYNARNSFAYVYDYGQQPPARFGLPQIPVFPTIGVSVVW